MKKIIIEIPDIGPPITPDRIYVLVAVDINKREVDDLNEKRLKRMGHKIPIDTFNLIENAIMESMQWNYWSEKVTVIKVLIDDSPAT